MNLHQLYKDNSKEKSSKKKTINQSVFDKVIKDELFDLWHASLIFFNELFDIIKELPEDLQVELLHTMSSAALAISTNISRASYAEIQEEFNYFLSKAIDAEKTTLGALKSIKQFGYINDEHFEGILNKGEAIKDRILILISEKLT